jgi:putative membrane protein
LVAIALLLRSGLADILRFLDIAGWRLLWLVPLHLVPLGCFGCAWRSLLHHDERASGGLYDEHVPSRVYLTWAAVVREAVGVLLPVARVGGEVVGARLLIRRGLSGTTAGASVVVELMLTVVAQLVFAIAGFVLLLGYPTVGQVGRLVAYGLLASALGVALFFVVQRRWGLFRLLERALSVIAGDALTRVIGDPARLDEAIHVMFRRTRSIAACSAWQLTGMVAGALELWVTLRLLGQPASVRASIVVESLSIAVQSITFMIPAGLGAQEGGFVLFGAAVGLSPQVALALSLARRVRQIALGLPALGSWYWIERQARRPSIA